MLHDFISLFFPDLCLACSEPLNKSEKHICIRCEYHLPKTNFHLDRNNSVSEMFWGKIELQAATSMYYFQKANKVQHLIHALKYHGHQKLGVSIGRSYGHVLRQSDLFNGIDVIIPVPLHKKKLRKRGYNQSEVFATGLAESMNIPTSLDLKRVSFTETQTKKSRWQRWKNVETVFQLENPLQFEGKHILIVDDVITTGSTIEACAQEFAKINNVKISVASIAFANNN